MMRERLLDWSTHYFVYACVGVVVALLTIAVRALAARLLPADTPFYYGLSIVIAYVFGIVCSYLGHRLVTFRHVTQLAIGGRVSFLAFVGVALLGLAVSMTVAMLVRYQLPLEELVGNLASTAAFAAGVLAASVLTFTLNRLVTFRSSGS